jgi:hypothetical protein
MDIDRTLVREIMGIDSIRKMNFTRIRTLDEEKVARDVLKKAYENNLLLVLCESELKNKQIIYPTLEKACYYARLVFSGEYEKITEERYTETFINALKYSRGGRIDDILCQIKSAKPAEKSRNLIYTQIPKTNGEQKERKFQRNLLLPKSL